MNKSVFKLMAIKAADGGDKASSVTVRSEAFGKQQVTVVLTAY